MLFITKCSKVLDESSKKIETRRPCSTSRNLFKGRTSVSENCTEYS